MSRLVGTILSALVICTSSFGLTAEPSETEKLLRTPLIIDRQSMEGGGGAAAGQFADNVLVQGATFGAIGDVFFDDSDRLCVSTRLIIDPESGSLIDELELTTSIWEPGAESPLRVDVRDLTIGPDGSWYWDGPMFEQENNGDVFLGDGVGRQTPDGVTTLQLVDPLASDYRTRDYSIAFSDDDRLFVVTGNFHVVAGNSQGRLFEVPELVEPPRLVIDSLGWLKEFDFGPDGFLYGPIWTEDRVVRIDVNADPPTVETVFDGHFVSAVSFDSQGRLAATDYGSGETLRVDVDTGAVEVVAQLTEGLSDLAFDSTDRLYVCSTIDGFVVEVLAGGDARTVVPGGLVAPVGVAVIPGAGVDRVFVADGWSLREIDGATGQQLGLTCADFVRGGLRDPIYTVAPHGDTLVVTNTNTVQVFDPEQGTILEEYTDFAYPANAISFRGDLVVTEWGDQDGPRVLRLSGSGTETLMDAAQGLNSPEGLAATDEDLWVADMTSDDEEWWVGTIWQLIDDGETLATPIPVITGLTLPDGLAVDAAGYPTPIVRTTFETGIHLRDPRRPGGQRFARHRPCLPSSPRASATLRTSRYVAPVGTRPRRGEFLEAGVSESFDLEGVEDVELEGRLVGEDLATLLLAVKRELDVSQSSEFIERRRGRAT